MPLAVNRELVGVDNWLKANRLSLNISKTSYVIIFNQKNAIDIKFEIQFLQVSTVKFLVFTLIENLTFNDHAKNDTSKISKCVGVMRRSHCQLPADVIVKLYCSLVNSHASDLQYALLT